MKEQNDSKKILFWTRITSACAIAVFICIFVITVTFLTYTPKIKNIMTNLDEISTQLNQSSIELTKTMKSLNDQGLTKIYETLDNIQKIDIEKLNDSIESLYGIIHPLSELFK